jgi:hypothetical protein
MAFTIAKKIAMVPQSSRQPLRQHEHLERRHQPGLGRRSRQRTQNIRFHRSAACCAGRG